jgi:hypothetical protein
MMLQLARYVLLTPHETSSFLSGYLYLMLTAPSEALVQGLTDYDSI